MWGYVEADFQRDYGINLVSELPRMSWRRFRVLLNGLSPYGALASHYEEAAKRQSAEDAREGGGTPDDVKEFWGLVMGVQPPNRE